MLDATARRSPVLLVRRGPRLAPGAWQELLCTVPAAERFRIEQLHRWEDRQDSAIGWQLLQRLSGESGLRRRANGRPECDPPLDVSLSHAGGWIAVATSQRGRVGVDVETLREPSPSLARRCLSAPELAWLAQEPEVSGLRFLRLWTAKEAYLKATGVGLSVDPRDISLDHTGDGPSVCGAAQEWRFTCSEPAPNMCVTLCEELV